MVGLSASSAARFAASFSLRFCFFLLTAGAVASFAEEGAGVCPFGLVVVWAIIGDVSDEVSMLNTLGTVMYFEPSLLVYFAEFLVAGEGGDWTACRRLFEGIPIGWWLKLRAFMSNNCHQQAFQTLARSLRSVGTGCSVRGEFQNSRVDSEGKRRCRVPHQGVLFPQVRLCRGWATRRIWYYRRYGMFAQ